MGRISPFPFLFVPSAARFPLHFPRPPRSFTFTRLSLTSRIPLLSITDRPMKQDLAIDELCAPTFPLVRKNSHGNLLPRHAPNVRSRANSLFHVCIYSEFLMGTIRPCSRLRNYANSQISRHRRVRDHRVGSF